MQYLVSAKIHMKQEQNGGRRCEFYADWCPHLYVGSPQPIAVRVIEVTVANQSGMIFPGEDGEVIFSLFPTSAVAGDPPLGFSELTAGGIFEILEGSRVVGTGKVLIKWTQP